MVGPAAMLKTLPRSAILKQIARANAIAGSPATAFRLDPKLVSRVELVLVQKVHNYASSGLKDFWRQNLPTLRFHNDDVDFVLTRYGISSKEELAKIVAKIIVHSPDGSTLQINCANVDAPGILDLVVKATNAVSVPELEIPLIETPQKYIKKS